MPDNAEIEPVRGRTLRWTFNDGPQAGKTYEHSFHEDGTVEYQLIEDEPGGAASSNRPADSAAAPERPPYAAYRVSDNVELISYRADSGFTLTVALDFTDHQLANIASNNEHWFPARGTFEVVSTKS